MTQAKLVFATGNPHKIREVAQMLPQNLQILSLENIGCTEDIPETQPTIEGNALQKAEYVRDNYHYDCFAEDTGLEVFALDMDPGVLSARYAGPNKDPEANMDKLLAKLKGKADRRARFKTVIALIRQGETLLFEGIVKGTIREKRSGTGGFGYDPIFQPDGYDQTFGELSAEIKNKISHRGKAIRKLVDYLTQQ